MPKLGSDATRLDQKPNRCKNDPQKPSAGRTGYSMILSLLNRWLFRLPIAWLLAWPLGLGALGLWWSFFLADGLGFLLGTG